VNGVTMKNLEIQTIKNLIRFHGISQRKLAERMGVSTGWLSMVLNGERKGSEQRLGKLWLELTRMMLESKK
jgi:transcriptional regulator with XRE-family HTH domain